MFIYYMFNLDKDSLLNNISIFTTILVNISILYVFYKTYFSKNLVLNFSLKEDIFFGKEITISIINKTLKTFFVDKIIIVLKNGDWFQIDYTNINIEDRTIESFKRINMKYNFSCFLNDGNFYDSYCYSIDRYEIYGGDEKIIVYRNKNFLFRKKIKKKQAISPFNITYDKIILSPKVRFVLYYRDNIDKKIKFIFVTEKGFANESLYKFDGKVNVGYNCFPEIKNVEEFKKYLIDNNFFSNTNDFCIVYIDDKEIFKSKIKNNNSFTIYKN